MIREVETLGQRIGIRAACQALGVSPSRFYRHRQPEEPHPSHPPSPPRRLSDAERQAVRATLNSPDFVDNAPREVYAHLLDGGNYLCHWRTMYRILAESQEVRERRDQLRHPTYRKPELLATAPNQVWSWDITKLLGPVKWSYFYLYVILDLYSRYVVGWMIALQEAAHLAEELIAETYRKQGLQPGQLTLHADRGNPMTSKPLALLLADLGVTKSHSRPYVSNDNPFSEAQFKTMKYRPDYPQRFGSLVDAREWGQDFFDWYNNEHYHTGIALLRPIDVHYGRAEQVLSQRQTVLQQAYQQHPERFVRGLPQPAPLPPAVWINPPQPAVLEMEDS
jgi:putative transposase